MEVEKPGKSMNVTSELLVIFDSLPDLRILVENEQSEESVASRQAKLKTDYMQRKVPFVCSEVIRHVSPCPECKKDFTAVDYLFFKDGAMLQLASIDGALLHRIREHGESFPEDVKRVLLNISNGIAEEPPSKSTFSRNKVDRSQISPFLVRVFIKHNQPFKDEDFLVRGKEPGEERYLHCWKDMNLRDITELLKEVDVTLRGWGTRAKYSFVYPDKRGKNVMKEVGLIDSHREGRDDLKTLDGLHFQTGDFVAVEVLEKK